MDYFDENYEPTTTSQTWRPPRGPFDEHVKAVLKAAALAPFTGEDPPALIRLGTETEVAGQLVEMLGGSDRAVYDRMQVRVFDPSGGWLQVEDGVLERAIMAFDGFTYTPESSPDKKRQLRVSNRMVAGVTQLVRHQLRRLNFFNDAADGAAFLSGLVRIIDGEVRVEPYKPDHRVLAEHIRSYDLVPFAELKANAFVKFMKESFAGCRDAEPRVQFLLEYLGASMLRMTWQHKANPILLGEKDTGKSVFLGLARGLFPQGTVVAVPLHAMANRFGLTPLLTAQFNVVSELPATDVKASEIAKAILVGDPVPYERKYRDPDQFCCFVGHLFAANALPSSRDPALRDRFVLIEFPNVVPPHLQDRGLMERLLAEVPSVASAAIYAARDGVVKRGSFARPPSSKVLARRWAQESDNVAWWVEGTFADEGEPSFVLTAQLHSMYRRWCEERGEKPVAAGTLGTRLHRLGFVAKNRGGRGYLVCWPRVLPPGQ